MIIDCHGHYTTAPPALESWRDRQLAASRTATGPCRPRAQSRRSAPRDNRKRPIEDPAGARQRPDDLFAPRGGMAHHVGNQKTSEDWSRVCNDLIYRVAEMFPKNFIGVCQLPQSPGVDPRNCIPELERCVNELGFVGCNLNPDPSGGWWKEPPLTDKWWYPLYEKMVELDVPGMIHVSSSCNPCFHATARTTSTATRPHSCSSSRVICSRISRR